jgi:hypothetical protein
MMKEMNACGVLASTQSGIQRESIEYNLETHYLLFLED